MSYEELSASETWLMKAEHEAKLDKKEQTSVVAA